MIYNGLSTKIIVGKVFSFGFICHRIDSNATSALTSRQGQTPHTYQAEEWESEFGTELDNLALSCPFSSIKQVNYALRSTYLKWQSRPANVKLDLWVDNLKLERVEILDIYATKFN